jgi:nucleoside-diphosphate-sugar epimerase
MTARNGILLTGATGQLGRYLLRELLAWGHHVAVLVRDAATTAVDRVRELHTDICESVGRRLPTPTAISGELRASGLGLGAADNNWLLQHCGTVVHSAACVSFAATDAGEPWLTNSEGTRRLLEYCGTLGIQNFHHISTAFVCGEHPGPVLETEALNEQVFRNVYERSKHAAETLVREQHRIRATIYRPSVIVGDSQTGHTQTYQSIYRFLELADRLAQSEKGVRKRRLPLRLPFTGDERRNLVPVDWVAQAIVRLMCQAGSGGLTYHLTTPNPTTVRDITEVAITELDLEGVALAGSVPVDASELERAFLDGLREYWAYQGSDPTFDCRNTLTALPRFPAPRIDRNALRRLIRFAVRDRWGRNPRNGKASGSIDCAHYIEQFFPAALSRSVLGSVPIEATLKFVISGSSGGNWTCKLSGGKVVSIERDSALPHDVEFRLDAQTFAAIVTGKQTPQVAFFRRRIEISGNIERGLKLAMLFNQFVREFPYDASSRQEPKHASTSPM